MIDPTPPTIPDLTENDDARLAEKVADLADRLRRGEKIDLSAETGDDAQALRELLPTIRILGGLLDAPDRESGLGRLGDFQLLREAGRGGMGIVYEAVQVSLGRRVALKVLLSAAALDPRHAQRFQLEARAAASLQHPSIVPVFAIGSEGGVPYYAMQFIDGRNLAGVIADWRNAAVETASQTRNRLRQAAELARQAAEALADAHDHEVLHRDIKPSNLLVDARTGRLWITDFGLARIQGELDLTHTGDHLGTPRYMSPEQALGRRQPLDGRTDVYSLGVTLYELLTLRPAFQADDRLTILRQIADAEPIPPRRIDPRIPVDLETIVLKALAKAPEDRYPTAADLAEDLSRFLNDRPIRARRPTVPERAAKWARRNRPIVLAATLGVLMILVALLGLGAGSIIWLQRHNVALRRAVERADAHARLARRHLFAFELRQAREFLDAGQTERAQDVLDAIETDPGDRDPRGFAWHYLSHQARREIIQLRSPDSRFTGHLLSPDGNTLAIRSSQLRIELWDPATRRRRADLTGAAIHAADPHFSPNSRLLIALESDRPSTEPWHRLGAVIWDVPGARLLARLPARSEGYTLHETVFVSNQTIAMNRVEDHHDRSEWVLWSLKPDPRRPRRVGTFPGNDALRIIPGGGLVIRDRNQLWLADPDTGTPRVELKGIPGTGTGSWARSADGRVVAAPFADGLVLLWDAATGAELERFRVAMNAVPEIRLSADGRYLAAQSRETGQIHLWDRTTRRSHTIQVDQPGLMDDRRMDMAFSGDSRWLAANAWGGPGGAPPIALWDVATGQRQKVCPASPPTGGASCLSFTSDSRFLIVEGWSTVKFWRLDPAPPITLAGHADEAWALAFSPDGRTLASGSDDSEDDATIKLWDIATGRLRKGWRADPALVAALAFSPDGRTLASASLDPSRNLRLWDAATGRLRTTLTGHTDRVRAVVFSPDGRWLASAGSDRLIRLWDARTGQAIGTLAGHADTVRKLAFGPDSRTLASASNDETVRLWDAEARRERFVLRGLDKFSALAMAPDGALLAAADESGRITLWNPATGALRSTILGDDAELFALAFSPDGRELAAAGASRVIRLWDLATGQELLSLSGHAARINALAFSPDGRTLASCSHDGAVRLWRSGPEPDGSP